ncbi:M2 family metallopeptidase [Burkholderiaceae bacterium DAT-1]|nr:M2 family metallopeptidase [Burkholderiaceae bacterium DAT-1]
MNIKSTSLRNTVLRAALLAAGLTLATPATALAAAKPTAAEAEKFINDAEARLEKLGINAQRAEWVAENFITDDTEVITSQAMEQLIKASGEIALASRRYNGVKLSTDYARKLKLLQLSLNLPDDKERERFTRLLAGLTGSYGKGKYCPKNTDGSAGKCMALGDLEKVLAESRDPAKLQEVWLGWHDVARGYKKEYAEYVSLANKGAREMGFKDNGALWRSGYDMSEQAFGEDVERVWRQVKPLYDSLHQYARYKLRQTYGHDVVPASGPIPAHLFGNMWSQSWENIYPILKPSTTRSDYDLSKVLEERKISAQDMVKIGEGFYTSLGMEKLPASFYERSLFVKPQDREVVCHASAWDIDQLEDVRIKMCIRPTEEEFITIHHELGHIYYDLAYRKQANLFRGGANDGFHEAIGDTIALSITPEYLKKIGLMDANAEAGDEITPLLQQALKKIAFLPFAYLVDNWRWQVYGGKVKPEDYDKVWWQLREQYQGVKRPVPATAGGFDAGAKFHVASDTPYARYFLAHILQFQFQRALCKEAGYSGPLNRCSIYGNKAAGAKYQAMLTLGTSKPWPEALKTLTGEDKLDGSAIIDYFAPLKTWLDAQNAELAKADPEVKS